jgi:hypothetical protein
MIANGKATQTQGLKQREKMLAEIEWSVTVQCSMAFLLVCDRLNEAIE